MYGLSSCDQVYGTLLMIGTPAAKKRIVREHLEEGWTLRSLVEEYTITKRVYGFHLSYLTDGKRLELQRDKW